MRNGSGQPAEAPAPDDPAPAGGEEASVELVKARRPPVELPVCFGVGKMGARASALPAQRNGAKDSAEA